MASNQKTIVENWNAIRIKFGFLIELSLNFYFNIIYMIYDLK